MSTASRQERLRALLAEFEARARPVRIVRKSDAWHQRWIARALWGLTLGGQDRYLTSYVTTLGHTIYVPDGWERWEPGHAWEVLRHELVHVRQFERYGWAVMVLVYGFVFLPAGLAWGRARLEWEAYRETLRCVAELDGLAAARDPGLRAQLVQRFTGPDYGWMWPFPRAIEGWIDAELAALEREQGPGSV